MTSFMPTRSRMFCWEWRHEFLQKICNELAFPSIYFFQISVQKRVNRNFDNIYFWRDNMKIYCLPKGRHSDHEKRLLCAQKCTRGGVGRGGVGWGWVMQGYGVGWVMQGWGGSWRGGWGWGRGGMGWGGSWRVGDRSCRGGVGWVMQGWGGSCRDGVGWVMQGVGWGASWQAITKTPHVTIHKLSSEEIVTHIFSLDPPPHIMKLKKKISNTKLKIKDTITPFFPDHHTNW